MQNGRGVMLGLTVFASMRSSKLRVALADDLAAREHQAALRVVAEQY